MKSPVLNITFLNALPGKKPFARQEIEKEYQRLLKALRDSLRLFSVCQDQETSAQSPPDVPGSSWAWPIFKATASLVGFLKANNDGRSNRYQNIFELSLILIESVALEGQYYLSQNEREKARRLSQLAQNAVEALKKEYPQKSPTKILHDESSYQRLTNNFRPSRRERPTSLSIRVGTTAAPALNKTFLELFNEVQDFPEGTRAASIYEVYERRTDAPIPVTKATRVADDPSSSSGSSSSRSPSPKESSSNDDFSLSNSGSPKSPLSYSAPALFGDDSEEDSHAEDLHNMSAIPPLPEGNPNGAVPINGHDLGNPSQADLVVASAALDRFVRDGESDSSLGEPGSRGTEVIVKFVFPDITAGQLAEVLSSRTPQEETNSTEPQEVATSSLPASNGESISSRRAPSWLQNNTGEQGQSSRASFAGPLNVDYTRLVGGEDQKNSSVAQTDTRPNLSRDADQTADDADENVSSNDALPPPRPTEPVPEAPTILFNPFTGKDERLSLYMQSVPDSINLENYDSDSQDEREDETEAEAEEIAALLRAGPPRVLPPEAIAMEKAREEESASSSAAPSTPPNNKLQPIPVPYMYRNPRVSERAAGPAPSETASRSKPSAMSVRVQAEGSTSTAPNNPNNSKPSPENEQSSRWLSILPKPIRERFEESRRAKKERRKEQKMQQMTADRFSRTEKTGEATARGNAHAETLTTNLKQRQKLREVMQHQQPAADFKLDFEEDVSPRETDRLFEQNSRSSYGSIQESSNVFSNLIDTVTGYLPDNPFSSKRDSVIALGAADQASAVILSEDELQGFNGSSSNVEPNTTLWHKLCEIEEIIMPEDNRWINWMTYEDMQIIMVKLGKLRGNLTDPYQLKIDSLSGRLKTIAADRDGNIRHVQGVNPKNNQVMVIPINITEVRTADNPHVIHTSVGATYTITVNQNKRLRFEMRKDDVFNALLPEDKEIAISEMSHAMARMARGNGTISNLVGSNQQSLAKNFKLEGVKKNVEKSLHQRFFAPFRNLKKLAETNRAVSQVGQNIYAQDQEKPRANTPRAQYLQAKRTELDPKNPQRANTFMRGLLHVMDDVIEGRDRYVENVPRSSSTTLRR